MHSMTVSRLTGPSVSNQSQRLTNAKEDSESAGLLKIHKVQETDALQSVLDQNASGGLHLEDPTPSTFGTSMKPPL